MGLFITTILLLLFGLFYFDYITLSWIVRNSTFDPPSLVWTGSKVEFLTKLVMWSFILKRRVEKDESKVKRHAYILRDHLLHIQNWIKIYTPAYKWGGSSRWSSSVYCLIRRLNLETLIFSWSLFSTFFVVRIAFLKWVSDADSHDMKILVGIPEKWIMAQKILGIQKCGRNHYRKSTTNLRRSSFWSTSNSRWWIFGTSILIQLR